MSKHGQTNYVTQQQLKASRGGVGVGHVHANMDILSQITPEVFEGWMEAYSARHSHDNKDALDLFRFDPEQNVVFLGDADEHINFAAFGNVSAGGIGSGGGGGGGDVSSIYVGTTQYLPDSNGIVHLPAYPDEVNWSNIQGKPSWIGANKPTYTLAELTGDSTHRVVTDAQITAWGNKQDSLGTGTSGQILKWGASGPVWSAAPAAGVASLGGKTGAIGVGTGVTVTAANTLTITPQYQTLIANGNTAYGYFSNGKLPYSSVSGTPTALSQFTNDSGYITGITSLMVTTALGYTPYNAANIGSASVAYASNAGAVGGYSQDKLYKIYGIRSTASQSIDCDDVSNMIQSDYRWTNAPSFLASTIGSMLDISYSEDWRMQLFANPGSDCDLYLRNRYNGTTWTDWHKIYHSGNFNPSSYMPLAGATVTSPFRVKKDLGGNLPDWIFYQHGCPAEFGRSTNTMCVAIGVTDDNFGVIQCKGEGIISNGNLVLNPGDGCVGIGRINAAYRFHVNGSFNALSGYINGDAIYNAGNCNNTSTPWSCSNLNIPIGGKIYNGERYGLYVNGSAADYGSAIYLTHDHGQNQTAFRIHSHYGSGIGELSFGFSTTTQSYGASPVDATYSDIVHIKGSGNVGIGTTSPSEKLHIVGNIIANRWYPKSNDKSVYIEYDSTNNCFKVHGTIVATGNVVAGA